MYVLHTDAVVSYEFSTSNHNLELSAPAQDDVVSYEFSTSNHNISHRLWVLIMLYLMSFLHQTTTIDLQNWTFPLLYLMSFLHQTTTSGLLFTYFQEVASILRHTKRILNYQRSVFDIIFLTTANILKKF